MSSALDTEHSLRPFLEHHLTSGDNYIFCSPVEKMLQDVINQPNVPEDALCKVHFDLIEGYAIEAPTLIIAMMRICDTTVAGLSDESSMKDVALGLLVKPCHKVSLNQ
ncbi:MAG: hypothetical protein ACFFEA_06530 [Candidatus Thorarchaeota archaeon]